MIIMIVYLILIMINFMNIVIRVIIVMFNYYIKLYNLRK